ncbi:hypothetical protein BDN70DRAFT_818516, partial [Pholiota conissans]
MSSQVTDSQCWAQLNSVTRYAILSHTWVHSEPGEMSYMDWYNEDYDLTNPGFEKHIQFCRAALENHRLSLGWMDTVCINKSSSSELDESIRSMYKWYQNSFICITHLSDTDAVMDIARDTWFTRGWTLQELLAPGILKFYGRNWNKLTASCNDKRNAKIQKQIKEATFITECELLTSNMPGISLSRKMQWAAKRQVTRSEDIAYSLMGLFDISISIAYGEGARRAFARLIKEIL